MIPVQIRAVPAVAATLLFTVLSMRAFELSSLLTLQLLAVLHPLYFWTVFRPALFPVWLAFLLGFAIDLISGSLLGLNAFLLVVAVLVIAKQRRYLLSQPFATQWAGFMVVAVAAESLRWAVMSLVTLTVFPPAPPLASAVCNAALYPLSALVMFLCLRLISPQSAEKLS